MVRVLSDALTAANTRQVTLLGLLDMSAAFDCVDHSMLLQRLERNFGISGLALQWLTSFLTDRTQQVTYNGTLSKLQRLLYGVPQGSVLGPLLFNLYTADLCTIVESHGHRLHQYADDCQVYVSVPVTDAAADIDRFSRCVADVSTWLSSSRLRLNPAKTVVIWLCGRQQVANISVPSATSVAASCTFSVHRWCASSRSCQHAWTTATVSCMVLLMDWRKTASREHRRQQHTGPVIEGDNSGE